MESTSNTQALERAFEEKESTHSQVTVNRSSSPDVAEVTKDDIKEEADIK